MKADISLQKKTVQDKDYSTPTYISLLERKKILKILRICNLRNSDNWTHLKFSKRRHSTRIVIEGNAQQQSQVTS